MAPRGLYSARIVAEGRSGVNRNRALVPGLGTDCRRGEIGGQPQQRKRSRATTGIVAEGRSGVNRNDRRRQRAARVIVAEGRSGVNRNPDRPPAEASGIVAEGRSGVNRNVPCRRPRRLELSPRGDRGSTATRRAIESSRLDCRRGEIGGQPQLADADAERPADCRRGEIGGQPQLGGRVGLISLLLSPRGDRGSTATRRTWGGSVS